MRRVLLFVMAMGLNVSAWGQLRAPGALELKIQGVPESERLRLDSVYVISKDGFINLWKIGKLQVAGKTEDQLAAEIARLYQEEKIYKNPVISIVGDRGLVTIRKTVAVGGNVKEPGCQFFHEGMTLHEAVAAAGGREKGKGKVWVRLYRNAKQYVYDLSKDEVKRMKVYPGDAVEVLEE